MVKLRVGAYSTQVQKKIIITSIVILFSFFKSISTRYFNEKRRTWRLNFLVARLNYLTLVRT